MDYFLENFKKDHQGNITSIGEIRFPPLDDKLDEITMSKVFSDEKVVVIEIIVRNGNDIMYNSFIENTNAQKNMPLSSSGNVGVSVSAEKPFQIYLFHRHLPCNIITICR